MEEAITMQEMGRSITASSSQQSPEDKIEESLRNLTWLNSKKIKLRALQGECQMPPNEHVPVTLLYSLMDDYEKEATKLALKTRLFKVVADETALDDIRTSPEDEVRRTLQDQMEELTNIYGEMQDVLKEQQNVSQQIVVKKEELQLKEDSYREIVTKQQEKKEIVTTSQHQEDLLRKKIQTRLMKINVMRMFIVNLLTAYGFNFLKKPNLKQLLLENRNPLDLQDL